MALQYDAPTASADVKAAVAANPSISASTTAAINTLLNLDTASTVVVAGWDGVAADATSPAGETADVLAISVAGTTATTLVLPDSVADAKVVLIDSDADINLTIGSEVSTFARAAFVAEPSDKIIVSGNGNDTITVIGSDNVRVDGGNGNDTITTGAGNDVINGGTGNDTIILGGGNDVVDGGTGRDVIQVQGDSTDFTPSLSLNGKTLYLNGDGSSVSITNTEFVSFDDGHTLSIVGSEAEATALGLYSGLLGRDADNGGAELFTNAVESGLSLTSVASSFLSSTEYQNNLNDSYVEGLYTSLLGRDADEGGEALFLNALANGTSRADVAASIATSAEAQTANLSDTAYIQTLFTYGLGRDATEADEAQFLTALTSGLSREDAATSIFNSAEATAKVNSDFVDSLYQNALGRTAEAEGKAGWVSLLEHGASQADVAIGIVGSQEAHDHATNVVVITGQV